VRYYPRWLSFKEAIRHFEVLQRTIPFEQHRVVIINSSVPQPRLTCWFGNGNYTYSGLTLKAHPLLPELHELSNKLKTDLDLEFNSILANYYRDGQDRVSWHADDERAIGPVIASVSLGEMRKFGIRNRELNKNISLDLQTGSLLIMAGETQKHCQHCIFPTKQNVGPRLNLTFRSFMI